ncbi:hypothetical protein [Amedibacillus sp. YH-ame10]
MKKVTMIFFVCIISLFLIGCEGNPGMNAHDYATGEEILNIVDDYLEGKKSGSETSRAISSLVDEFEEEDRHITSNVIMSAELIESSISAGESTSKIKEERDEMAGYLYR